MKKIIKRTLEEGVVKKKFYKIPIPTHCRYCAGRGRLLDNSVCPKCQGEGEIWD